MKIKKSKILEDYSRIWACCEYEMTDYYNDFIEFAYKYNVSYKYDHNLRKKDNLCYLGDKLLSAIQKILIKQDIEIEI